MPEIEALLKGILRHTPPVDTTTGSCTKQEAVRKMWEQTWKSQREQTLGIVSCTEKVNYSCNVFTVNEKDGKETRELKETIDNWKEVTIYRIDKTKTGTLSAAIRARNAEVNTLTIRQHTELFALAEQFDKERKKLDALKTAVDEFAATYNGPAKSHEEKIVQLSNKGRTVVALLDEASRKQFRDSYKTQIERVVKRGTVFVPGCKPESTIMVDSATPSQEAFHTASYYAFTEVASKIPQRKNQLGNKEKQDKDRLKERQDKEKKEFDKIITEELKTLSRKHLDDFNLTCDTLAEDLKLAKYTTVELAACKLLYELELKTQYPDGNAKVFDSAGSELLARGADEVTSALEELVKDRRITPEAAYKVILYYQHRIATTQQVEQSIAKPAQAQPDVEVGTKEFMIDAIFRTNGTHNYGFRILEQNPALKRITIGDFSTSYAHLLRDVREAIASRGLEEVISPDTHIELLATIEGLRELREQLAQEQKPHYALDLATAAARDCKVEPEVMLSAFLAFRKGDKRITSRAGYMQVQGYAENMRHLSPTQQEQAQAAYAYLIRKNVIEERCKPVGSVCGLNVHEKEVPEGPLRELLLYTLRAKAEDLPAAKEAVLK